jgi:hypothetical protein
VSEAQYAGGPVGGRGRARSRDKRDSNLGWLSGILLLNGSASRWGTMGCMSGHLQITTEQGRRVENFMIAYGGGVTAAINGERFVFQLDSTPVPAPPPRELESMSTVEVAEYLRKRIADEESEREQDAIEASEWDD